MSVVEIEYRQVNNLTAVFNHMKAVIIIYALANKQIYLYIQKSDTYFVIDVDGTLFEGI